MKRWLCHFIAIVTGLVLSLMPAPTAWLSAQGKNAKENWDLEHQEILDHPEAELLVRHGSINNLGFGWPAGFDPFSGESTPEHAFPWDPPAKAAAGTDRILVISSYKGNPPAGSDGYTNSTSRPGNLPHPIPIKFTPPKITLHSAVLQVFVDDFQAPVWQSKFQVTMNGWRVPEIEAVLNSLNQTGPIGKLVTFQLPAEVVKTLATGKLTILIDDPTTGAGDGFAFDFFRLLINPRGRKYQGSLTGRVTDADTGKPIAGATVSAGGVVKTQTTSDGNYQLNGVPAGLASLTFSATNYQRKTVSIDLPAGKSFMVDAQLKPVSEEVFRKLEAEYNPRLLLPPEPPVISPKVSFEPTKKEEPRAPSVTTAPVSTAAPMQEVKAAPESKEPAASDSEDILIWVTLAIAGAFLLVALLAGVGFAVYRLGGKPPNPGAGGTSLLQQCLACGQKVQVTGARPGMRFNCPKCGAVGVISR